MKKSILTAIMSLLLLVNFCVKSNAQATLIHYWNFNTLTGAMHLDTIHGIDADYSTYDTSKAKILYAVVPGTSASYATYEDAYTTVTADYDTVNLRLSAVAGVALRVRNPSDSMQLLFYMPSVHYTHILLQYGSESSSVASGMTHQLFDYSVDSGATWRTSGLSETSDSAWLAFHRTAVSLATDSSVKNNNKLVFRIRFSGHNTGTTGNNRFDNVTVEGDSIIASTIAITASPSGAICAGNAVTFSANATYTNVTPYYHWYVNGIAVGTDSTGFTTSSLTSGALVKCVLTDSVDGSVLATSNVFTATVTAVPTAGVISGASNICPATSATFTETVPGGTWTATNANATVSTAGVVHGVTAGVDTIHYHVSNICGSADTTFIVTISTSPSSGTISGSSTVCTGTPDALSETISGGVWSVSNSHATVSTLGSVSGVTAGIDTVLYTVTTSCGSSIASYPVTINVSPAAGTISGSAAICIGTPDTLSETASGGTWTSANSNADVSTAGIVTGITAGADTIRYTVTSASCGSAVSAYPVTINAAPSAGVISGSATVCIDSMTTLIESASGGTWTVGNSNATISTSGVVTGVTAGSDLVTYTVSNSCGSNTATQDITINTTVNPGAITASADTVCVGFTLTLSDTATGGLWLASNANATIGLTGTVTGVTAGIDTMVYGFENACGISYAQYIITVRPASACASGVGIVNGSSDMLNVFPNPSTGTFTIDITSAVNESAQIKITNMVGGKVKEMNITTNQPYEMGLNEPAGIYFIDAVTSHGKYTTKLILAH